MCKVYDVRFDGIVVLEMVFVISGELKSFFGFRFMEVYV